MARIRTLAIMAIAACTFGAAQAAEADFPSRPITLVVPFPAGGVVDVEGRLIAERMQALLKGSIIVLNKPGAGGTLGASQVAHARPDGYTVLMGGSATQVFGPAIYARLPYDATKDLMPVGQIGNGPLMVTVGSKSKATNLKELVAELKREGNRANYGSNGSGTFPHLAGELFKQQNHLQMVHVPFSGGPEVVTALIRGDVDVSINHIPVVQAMVRAGKLRALATTGAKRSAAFPDLPTVAEAGFPGFEASAWFGLFVPAGTPTAVIDKLSGALESALNDPELRTKLLAQGDEPAYKGPDAFAHYIAEESAHWTPVIRSTGISVD